MKCISARFAALADLANGFARRAPRNPSTHATPNRYASNSQRSALVAVLSTTARQRVESTRRIELSKVDPAGRPYRISRHALCPLNFLPRPVLRHVAFAAATIAVVSGCAVRYDGNGITRVGVGLWGLGDPPGVNWNLDWPRREVPELPAMRPRERPDIPASLSAPGNNESFIERHDRSAEHYLAIDDNRGCVFNCDSLAGPSRVAPRGGVGNGDAVGISR